MQHQQAIEVLGAELENIGRDIAAAEKDALSLEDGAIRRREYMVLLCIMASDLKRAISTLKDGGSTVPTRITT